MMIELISVTNNNVKHYAAVGITAAELPVKDLGTGSECKMLDTGKKYIFFEGSRSWYEEPSGSGGGGGGEVKAALSIHPELVNFIDYEGTVVEQWNLDSLPEKTELPAFPEHAGLTAQGWNWTLEDIQDFGKPNVVGMLYVTDDGWSRFYLDIDERREIAVLVTISGVHDIVVDWGDGTKETVTIEYSKVLKHVYPSSREFILRINGNGANYGISYIRYYDPVTGEDIRNTYYGIVRKIESGQGMGFNTSAFQYAVSLGTVSFPEDLKNLGVEAFAGSGLRAAVLPKGIKTLFNSIFNEARWLEVFSLPRELQKMGYKMFCKCRSLTFAVVPDRVTTIDSSEFADCSMLEAAVLGDAISSGGGALFSCCMKLKSVTLPEGLTQLPGQAFYYCASLQKVTVGSKVTAIANTSFSACKVLKELTFLTADPPVGANGMFVDLAAGFVIRVPKGSGEAYKSAEFWSDYADNIVEME
ncbi:MAG: leucine-rich repeat domain-containing protein [Oliverpabstia sp.]|nr:leucine-rich repeat domain-containing protein [Oliverpabstia sp.]